MKDRPQYLRFKRGIAQALAVAVLAIAAGREVAAQTPAPVPPGLQAQQIRQMRRAQPQFNALPARGPRGEVLLGDTAAGLTMPMGGTVLSSQNATPCNCPLIQTGRECTAIGRSALRFAPRSRRRATRR